MIWIGTCGLSSIANLCTEIVDADNITQFEFKNDLDKTGEHWAILRAWPSRFSKTADPVPQRGEGLSLGLILPNSGQNMMAQKTFLKSLSLTPRKLELADNLVATNYRSSK